jgi:RNA polymerase sigma-70 factor, ECF subfamily
VDIARAKNAEHTELTRSLVCRLRQGDDQAGTLLDALYRTRLLRFSLGYLGSREEAEDVVQEVFYRVLASDKVPDCFRAWVYQITRNRCLDLLRTRKRRPRDEELPSDSQLVARVTGNLTRLVHREQQERVARALRFLPLHQQEVIRLRYAEGLSRAEIGKVLDLAESVVKSRLYEGIEVMRRQISSVGENP